MKEDTVGLQQYGKQNLVNLLPEEDIKSIAMARGTAMGRHNEICGNRSLAVEH